MGFSFSEDKFTADEEAGFQGHGGLGHRGSLRQKGRSCQQGVRAGDGG